MRALFLRLYGAILLSLVLALPFAGLIVVHQYARTEEVRAEGYMRYTSRSAASRLRASPPLQRAALARQISDQAGLLLELVPLPQVPDELRARVEADQTAATMRWDRSIAVYQQVDEQSACVAVVPPLSLRYSTRPLLTGSVVLLAMAAGLVTQLWPLQRELQRLASAAERFGAGDLDARVSSRDAGPVGDLARTFDRMAARIQRGVDEQRNLLRAVSHELRTPLARARFGVALMGREEDAARRAAQADRVDANLAELDALVDELLSYVRLDPDGARLSREDVALGPLLAELEDRLEPLFPERELHAELGPEATVFADARLLSRILENLLSNALRYARRRVEVHADHSSEGWVIDVDDDGPGIPVADRERVFLPFERLSADRGRESGGVGLGLAIVARAARLHGGSVVVQDSPMGGARLRLVLPA